MRANNAALAGNDGQQLGGARKLARRVPLPTGAGDSRQTKHDTHARISAMCANLAPPSFAPLFSLASLHLLVLQWSFASLLHRRNRSHAERSPKLGRRWSNRRADAHEMRLAVVHLAYDCQLTPFVSPNVHSVA